MNGRQKYHAQRTEYGGHVYDSKAEATRAMELDMMMRGGVIQGWLRQVRVALGPDFNTTVDFLVLALDGGSPCPRAWVEEVKGMETRQFKKAKALWPKYAPLEMRIYRCRGYGCHLQETIPGKDPASR